MRPFSLLLPDADLPDVAYPTLGRAISAGRYRYAGQFETRSDERDEALATLPRIAGGLWIDHLGGGDVHRVEDGVLTYEGDLLDLLGYPGVIDRTPADNILRLRFNYGDLEPVLDALRASIIGESLKPDLRKRLLDGDVIVMSRPSLVRTMVNLAAGVNDRRRDDPGSEAAVNRDLIGIMRFTSATFIPQRSA